MASYSQQYYQSGPGESRKNVSAPKNSYSDLYLQDGRRAAKVSQNEEPAQPVRSEDAALSEPGAEVYDRELVTQEVCPEHLRMHESVLFQGARSDIRLPASEERRLQRSTGELSLVEGNLLGRRRKVRSVYVTSCFAGEGKTTAAVSTAYALSSLSGRRVLLIDGNNSAPRLHSLFGVRQAPGLSDCLKKEVSLSSICVPTAYSGLFFLPAGSHLSHGLSFFVNEIGMVLREAGSLFDYVVWDGTSVLQGSQASALATLFDGLSLVVECEKTKWEVVQMAKEKIENSGGEIVGVVMNKRKFYIPRLIYKILSNR